MNIIEHHHQQPQNPLVHGLSAITLLLIADSEVPFMGAPPAPSQDAAKSRDL